MEKVKENIDLSRKVLDVSIDSPVFQPMLENLNEKIIEVIKQVYSEDFESGDITLKLTLKTPETVKEFPSENEDGEPTTKLYQYKALQFEHKISTTLKRVDKDEGRYYGEKELKEEDGHFIEISVEEPQISIFDTERGAQNAYD